MSRWGSRDCVGTVPASSKDPCVRYLEQHLFCLGGHGIPWDGCGNERAPGHHIDGQGIWSDSGREPETLQVLSHRRRAGIRGGSSPQTACGNRERS